MLWWQQLPVDAVHSSRNLPQASQSAPNEQTGASGQIGCSSREQQVPPLRSPGFPVELGGAGKLHAPFLTERRTRGPVRYCVAGNPGSLPMNKNGLPVELGAGR